MFKFKSKANAEKETIEQMNATTDLFKSKRTYFEQLKHDQVFPIRAYYLVEAEFYKKMATAEGRQKRNAIQASDYKLHVGDLYMSDSVLFIIAMGFAALISSVLLLIGIENAFLGIIAFTFFGLMVLTETEAIDFTKGKPIPELTGQIQKDIKGNIVVKDNTELKAFMDWISHLNVRVTSKETNKRYEMMLIPSMIYTRLRHFNYPEKNGLEVSGTLALDTYVHIKQNLPLALAVATNPDTPGPAKYDAECSIEQMTAAYLGQIIIDYIEGSKEEREHKAHEAALLKEQIKLERKRAEHSTKAEDIVL